jgi:hypothetical protein
MILFILTCAFLGDLIHQVTGVSNVLNVYAADFIKIPPQRGTDQERKQMQMDLLMKAVLASPPKDDKNEQVSTPKLESSTRRTRSSPSRNIPRDSPEVQNNFPATLHYPKKKPSHP